MPDKIERVTIQAFRAVDLREHTIRYIVEHHRVLEDIGVTSALKMDYGWCLDPETIVVVATHSELGLVGGCRIQFARDYRELPVYKHLSPLEPALDLKLDHVWGDRCFELAGLWVAHRFTGRGLPWFLTAAAVSVMNKINAKNVFCFAAEYSMNYAVQNGFKIVPSVGKGGQVDFPIQGITSYLLLNSPSVDMTDACPQERARLLSLQSEPDQVRVEKVRDRELQVTYRLSLSKRLINLFPDQRGKPADKRLSA